MNGQSCPARAGYLIVERDDFPDHYFVTMVMIALKRSIRYPTWECGGSLGLAQDLSGLSAPLLGPRTWLLEQVSCQLPADSRACLFSKESASVTYTSAFWLENETVFDFPAAVQSS